MNKAERIALLKKAVQSLTDAERMVCIWRKAGYSDQEIGTHLGMSALSVAETFSRAMNKLRGMLKSPKPID